MNWLLQSSVWNFCQWYTKKKKSFLQGVSGISEITGDFELDFMYSEIWEDPRLSFKHLNVCTTNITLKSDFRKKIWTPDTCIINSKEAAVHTSPSENTFVILYEHGLLWSNFRLVSTLNYKRAKLRSCKQNQFFFARSLWIARNLMPFRIPFYWPSVFFLPAFHRHSVATVFSSQVLLYADSFEETVCSILTAA